VISTLDDLDLSTLIENELVESRRDSLEAERSEDLPIIVDCDEQSLLGEYLKFVNREKSIKVLLKHAAAQYSM
jgi:hypothetical protein